VEPWFVVAVFAYGVEEPGEVVEVGFGPPDGIVDHGAGLHYEGPVGGLGEKQLAGGLVQGSGFEAVGAPVFVDHIYHTFAGFVEVAVDPLVRLLQPYFVVSLVPPAGGVGYRYLVDRVHLQVLAGGDQPVAVLVVGGFAEKVV